MEIINPTQYEKNISFWQFLHAYLSILSTGAIITLCWFSFSTNSPLSQKNPDPEKFNAIAYPIFAVLFIIGYSIANSATIGFRPEYIYLPLIGLFLSLINIISYLHNMRTQERNADFCALFGKVKYDTNELDKHIQHYASHASEYSFFKELVNTHPHSSERAALLIAAKNQLSSATM